MRRTEFRALGGSRVYKGAIWGKQIGNPGYGVFPIDDRTFERFNASIAGRPDLMGDRTSLTLYEGMTGMMENAFINVKNRSHTITAEVEIPEGGGEGVILAQGGRFAGWSLYMKDGRVS